MAGRDRGYDEQAWAPGLSARVIQEHIKKPLAEELLFGALSKGGVVRVAVKEDGTLDLQILPPGKPPLSDSKTPLLTAG